MTKTHDLVVFNTLHGLYYRQFSPGRGPNALPENVITEERTARLNEAILNFLDNRHQENVKLLGLNKSAAAAAMYLDILPANIRCGNLLISAGGGNFKPDHLVAADDLARRLGKDVIVLCGVNYLGEQEQIRHSDYRVIIEPPAVHFAEQWMRRVWEEKKRYA